MTAFDHIVGHENIKRVLQQMVKENTLGNSLLFTGPDGVGKSLVAGALATLILGSEKHPDLHHYFPEGKLGLHNINVMRQFCQDVYMAPYKGNKKIFILHEAERMLPYSANALLKTFEEPLEDALIILLTSHPNTLLPTILSRCCTFRFHALKESDITKVLHTKLGQTEERAAALAIRAKGSLGHACMLLQEEGNEARKHMLMLLAGGKQKLWRDLTEAAESIATKISQLYDSTESSPRLSKENLSAVQLQSLEQEAEGIKAINLLNEAYALFNVVLGWFRDLHLLHVGGNKAWLFHPDKEVELEQSLQRGEILPLEVVQKAISQAKLSLERSTPLHHCLETLFLQLNLL